MEIEWTKSGQNSLVCVLKYIEGKFGENVAKNVSERIFHKVSLLKENPGMGKLFTLLSEKKICCLLVHKRCKIFYNISLQGKIYILFVWDVRQNPELLNRLLQSSLL